VTSIAIREARIKEIKREMMTSTKLKSFFEAHPKDLKLLRHDRALHTVKLQPHMKDVPEYIVPPTLKSMVANNRIVKRKRTEDDDLSCIRTSIKNRKRKGRSQKNNPLKTFKTHEKKKKRRK